jgi:CubicO group peptidase (beta-lactamase class C family)
MEFGEVGLNDAVRKFIPEFRFGDVTIYHLLTQTSGLTSENIMLPDNYAAMRDFYRKLYEKLGRGFLPGAKSEHFKYGYAVLADILGRVSRQMLEELASVLLFMPLGMKYTTYNGAALRDGQYVIPWNHKENRFMSELHTKYPTGQTGVYTTALDLIRFGRLFLNGGEYEGKQVFLESSVDFMLREVTDAKFMRTPVFMIKRQVDIFGCFSEKQSPDAVALTGDTGSVLFVDPRKRTVGAALTNSTWVHSVSRNYSNIIDILSSI